MLLGTNFISDIVNVMKSPFCQLQNLNKIEKKKKKKKQLRNEFVHFVLKHIVALANSFCFNFILVGPDQILHVAHVV